MKTQIITNCLRSLTPLICFLLVSSYPSMLKGTEIPLPEEVVARKAQLPTIADLTEGKVKKGDLIDKNNVDLIKQWLSPGVLEGVMQGWVLRMGTNSLPDESAPKGFIEATERNSGKAIMDENGTVYYEKMGEPWPGGIPFVEPKNGLEVMANMKYGMALDDYTLLGDIQFVNKEGKVYKSVTSNSYQVYTNRRCALPPLGTWPGYENQMYRVINVLMKPIEIKGQGQFAVRYYDDTKNYDTGFMYFPAFKRTMRISSTTWQDNIGGSDMTQGDREGLKEPYSDWNFKLLGTKYILAPEHRAPFDYLDKKGNLNPKLQWDVGRRWPRFGWAVFPFHVVEAIPKVRHIYSKKILYMDSAPYWQVNGVVELMDMYDQQGGLWKLYCLHNGYHNEKWDCLYPWGLFVCDLQAQHTSQYWFFAEMNVGLKPSDASFKELIAMGR